MKKNKYKENLQEKNIWELIYFEKTVGIDIDYGKGSLNNIKYMIF